MTKNDLLTFVLIASGNEPICAYTPEKAVIKERFHRLGKQICRALAREMGLPKGSYSVRSSLAGIAVSGEIMLHGEFIYLQFSQTALGPSFGFMYRYCRGQQDCGGDLRYCPNVWAPWNSLLNLGEAAQTIKMTCEKYRERDPKAKGVLS